MAYSLRNPRSARQISSGLPDSESLPRADRTAPCSHEATKAAYSARLGRLPETNFQPLISFAPEPDSRGVSGGPQPASTRISSTTALHIGSIRPRVLPFGQRTAANIRHPRPAPATGAARLAHGSRPTTTALPIATAKA